MCIRFVIDSDKSILNSDCEDYSVWLWNTFIDISWHFKWHKIICFLDRSLTKPIVIL